MTINLPARYDSHDCVIFQLNEGALGLLLQRRPLGRPKRERQHWIKSELAEAVCAVGAVCRIVDFAELGGI